MHYTWGAGWLANVVRNNNLLKSLDLRGNPIGYAGMEELSLACESSSANLVLAEAAFVTVRVCGKRNVSVYCDGDIAVQRDEEDDDFVDTVFRASNPAAKKPVALMKRNKSLGIFEPCSMMSDQRTKNHQTNSFGGKAVRYTGCDSEVNLSYTRVPTPGLIYEGIKQERVLNTVNCGAATKECVTSMGQTRLRYKPRHGYFSYYFK